MPRAHHSPLSRARAARAWPPVRAIPALAVLAMTSMVAAMVTWPDRAGAQEDEKAKLSARRLSSLGPAAKRARPDRAKPKAAPKKARPSRGRTPPPPNRPSSAPFADLKRVSSKKCRPLPPNARVNFDFKGDIKELVQTISETTCKNFILTNKVRSQKFEIVSPTPITVDEAWRAFLSALEANDFSLVRVGRYYKVIQSTDGTRSPVPIYEKPGTSPVQDRMVTQIWKLKHGGDINKTVNYLNIFKSGKGQIHPFDVTNTIIATDYGTSIARLERILREIDVPGALEQVHVVPVEFASATEIAEKLTQVFEPSAAGQNRGRGAKAPPKPRLAGQRAKAEMEMQASVSKILADERTNKLIIIASESSFRQIMELKRELDIPDTGVDGQIHVLRLKHADAEELASTLANLAQGRPGTPPRRPPGRAGRGGRIPPAGQGQGASLFEGEVKITADKATNSLVITASKSDLASVKRVVEKLDVARYQVFVEAAILEVSLSRTRELGIGAHAIPSPIINGEASPFVIANTPNRELSSLVALANPTSLAALTGFVGALGGPPAAGTEQLITGGLPSVGVIFRALQTSNDVNVISTPHLLTMDNEEAEIQVADRRPFPSGLTLGGLGALGGAAGSQAGQALGNLGGLGLGQVSINREDIGLTLKLTPQINDADYVKLEIDQEVSDVGGTDNVTGQQITNKRTAKTTVVVRSQESVVIGGLVRDRETISEGKTPLLGDIPLIGWLFKQQRKVIEKVNLVLILTPYIIRGPEDFRKIFERQMAERKEFLDRFYGMTEEYRALIDWDQKVGPLGSYRRQMREAMSRLENDGFGTAGEEAIRPGVGPGLPQVDGPATRPRRRAPLVPIVPPPPDAPRPQPEQE